MARSMTWTAMCTLPGRRIRPSGTVSGLDPATMIELSAERGGDPARPGKKDPLDALVWLAARPGEPCWDSEFGAGRPGWHVECAAIATEYLGAVFDVQAGGTDLVFPHHELSASHARVAAGGGPVFARRYAHAGMVRFGGEKMSKSLGNLVFVSALRAAGVDPMAIRLAILANHYRQDWDWTDAGLAAAADRLARWRRAVSADAAVPAAETVEPAGEAAVPAAEAAAEAAEAAVVLAAVRERMADDLDAPGALAAVDQWVTAVLAGSPRGRRGAGQGHGRCPAWSRPVAGRLDASPISWYLCGIAGNISVPCLPHDRYLRRTGNAMTTSPPDPDVPDPAETSAAGAASRPAGAADPAGAAASAGGAVPLLVPYRRKLTWARAWIPSRRPTTR